MGDINLMLQEARALLDKVEAALSALPLDADDDPLWPRDVAGPYLKQKYGVGSHSLLAALARDGEGPHYEIVRMSGSGRAAGRALYRKSELDRWALERIERPETRGRPRTETPGPRTLARRKAEAAAAEAHP